MKQNTFSLITLSILVSFALIFSGGCGGSSTSSLFETQSSSSVQSYVAASEMVSVMQGEKFAKMFSELEEQGVFERAGNWYLMYNVSEDIQAKILGQLSGEERESMARSFYSADLVAEKYNSGEVVAIAYPDETIINKVLEAAGLEAGYKMHDSDKNGKLEIYAIAKRIAGGREVLSAYTVPCAVNFDAPVPMSEDPGPVSSDEDAELLSSDVSSDGTASDDKQEITPEIMDNEDFQVKRWQRFFLWCAELDYDSFEASAYADRIDVKAAENYIVSIAQAQRETLDLSYCYDNGRRQNWFSNWKGIFEIIYNRTNTLNYTIYSAHSLNDECDYYFIRGDVTTKPNDYIREYDIVWEKAIWNDYEMPFNWLSGYTDSVETTNYIDNGSDGGRTADGDVEIVDALPTFEPFIPLENMGLTTLEKVLERGTHTMSYTVPGRVVYSDGNSGSYSDSVTYYTSLLWYPPYSRNLHREKSVNYNMIMIIKSNASPSSISWRVEHAHPYWSSVDFTDIPSHLHRRTNYQARPPQKDEFSYHTSWIYKVSPSYRNKSSSIYLNVEAKFAEGVTRGALDSWIVKSYETYHSFGIMSRSRKFRLIQPPQN